MSIKEEKRIFKKLNISKAIKEDGTKAKHYLKNNEKIWAQKRLQSHVTKN